MNNLDRDALVERYVSGRMSPSEEEHFLRLAGDDPELRHLVKAERIIRGAALKSRETLMRPAGDPSGHLMARLAATPPATPSPQAPAPTATTVVDDRRPATSVLQGRMTRLVAAAVGVAGLAIGALVAIPRLSPDTDDVPPATTVTAPVTPGATSDPAGSAQAPPGTGARPADVNGALPSSAREETRPASGEPRRETTTSGASGTAPARAAAPVAPTASGTASGAASHGRATTDPEELPVIERDSLQLKVNIEEN